MPALLTSLLREPLIQFLFLGVVIFVADQWVSSRQEDPHRIAVDDARFQELEQIFIEGQGRAPSSTEMKNIIIKWAENEVLYREALSMGLEEGDEMIRSRIILKLQNILLNNAMADAPTEGELEEFFEFNREKYNIPEKLDVEQFVLSDQSTPEQAVALAERLNEGGEMPASYEHSIRGYQQRPASNLMTLFGDTFAKQLLDTPEGNWITLKQPDRLRLVRIAQRHPASAVELEQVKSAVTRDWKKFRYDMQLADQTRAIADRYSIEMALSPDQEKKMQLSISTDELHQDAASSSNAAPRAVMN